MFLTGALSLNFRRVKSSVIVRNLSEHLDAVPSFNENLFESLEKSMIVQLQFVGYVSGQSEGKKLGNISGDRTPVLANMCSWIFADQSNVSILLILHHSDVVFMMPLSYMMGWILECHQQ